MAGQYPQACLGGRVDTGEVPTVLLVSTLAGQPGVYGSTDGSGSAARFGNPAATAVDSFGNIYVADWTQHVIRKITPEGVFLEQLETDPAKYLPALAKTNGYKGVTGNITFDEKGDIKNGALTLYTYKGGERSQLAVVR